MRSCSGCTACCKLRPVPDLQKKENECCAHQRHDRGCMIYRRRPVSCQIFRCWWLVDPHFPLPRPDRAGYVVDPTPDVVVLNTDPSGDPLRGEKVAAFSLWTSRPDAHRDPELRAWLQRRIGRDKVLIVVRGAASLTLVPPAQSSTGDWLELEVRNMRPGVAMTVQREFALQALEDAQKKADEHGGL